MYSKNFRPSSRHKIFHNNLFNLGCVITGAWPELHHVLGSSYLDGNVWIGQDYIIPLSPELHRKGVVNATTSKQEFYDKVGSEKKLFIWVLTNYVETYKELPIPGKELVTILNNRENLSLISEKEVLETKEALNEFIFTLNVFGFEETTNLLEENLYGS